VFHHPDLEQVSGTAKAGSVIDTGRRSGRGETLTFGPHRIGRSGSKAVPATPVPHHPGRALRVGPGRPHWKELGVVILGVILLILGFVFAIPVLWTIGIIVIVVGAVLLVLGATGRAIGGRKYWY